MESVTDLSLARAWRGGNSSAGRELHARHRAFVRRFFAAKTPAAVDELVAATFAACHAAATPLVAGAGFRSTLLEFARAELARHLRRRRQGRPGDPVIERMPLPVRMAFELTYRDRLPRDEVADALGISPRRVDRRLRRAHRCLGRAEAFASSGDRVSRARSSVDS